jgi:hypothetical protein
MYGRGLWMTKTNRESRLQTTEIKFFETRYRDQKLYTGIRSLWCGDLLEKLIVANQESPHFLWYPKFIAVLTRERHRSVSGARWIHSIPQHPIFLRSILVLSSHLYLGLPSGLFTSGFPTEILLIFLSLITDASHCTRGEEKNHYASSESESKPSRSLAVTFLMCRA